MPRNGKHWHRPERVKACIVCSGVKPLGAFYAYAYTTKQGKRSTRYESRCLDCARARRRDQTQAQAPEMAKRAASRQEARASADIRDYLSYDPVTGIFTWKALPPGPIGKMRLGEVAGCLTPLGYRIISFMGEKYWGHHLAWLFFHGEWPAFEIDHRDGADAGDGISNLRPATRSQNNANQRPRMNTTSQFKGVWRSGNKWAAQVQHQHERRHLGRFDDEVEAARAYDSAALIVFGEYARINGV